MDEPKAATPATGDGVEDETTPAVPETDTEAPKAPVPPPSQKYREDLADRIAAERGAKPEPAEEPEVTPEPEEPVPSLEPKKYKVKVDGKDLEVTEAELIKSYQIESAAKKRLQEATELKKQIRADLEKAEAAKAPKDQAGPEGATLDGDFDVDDYIRQIREGEDEDAADATRKFINSVIKAAQKTGAPQSDIDSLVEQKLKERDEQAAAEATKAQQEAAKEAEEHFQDLYKDDLAKSDDFYDLAILADRKLLQDDAWKDRSFKDRYVEAGIRARDMVAKMAGKTVRDRKTTDKEALADLPAGTRRSGVEKPEITETPADILREMAKSRGQHL